MMWEALFHDLESQWIGQSRLDREGEIVEMTDAEAVEVELRQRFLAMLEKPVQIRLRNGEIVEAQVVDCAQQWLLLGQGTKRWLVPHWALVWAKVSGKVAPAPELRQRMSFTTALRALAQGRQKLRVVLDQTHLTGFIRQVSADHIIFDSGEAGGPVAIPLSVITVVISC